MNKKIDFIGIGTQKSGTTWIAECLEEHPEVLFPGQKELFFFNRSYCYLFKDENISNHSKGIDWYLSQFPETERNQIRGEFATNYYNDPLAAAEIKKHFPKVKILIMLRNPIEMIYSLFWWQKGANRETANKFESALKENPIYLNTGSYYQNLKRYYNLFKNNQIHPILFDDIENKPEKVIKDLFSFLRVGPNFKPKHLNEKINTSRKFRSYLLSRIGVVTNLLRKMGINFTFLKKLGLHQKLVNLYGLINKKNIKYPPMKPETRQKLKEYYKEDIKKLEQLIKRDLSMWLK